MQRDPVTLDSVDQKLLHALHLDARAAFARIGEVIGVSDRTVARRYTRLREGKVINLVGVVDPSRLDGAEWVVRMQCKPGSALQVAEALARRDDTRWVALLSGGTEICASLRAWSARERDELILQRLHRTTPVVSVTAHSVLNVFSNARHGFEGPGPLTTDQIVALQPKYGADIDTLVDADRPLLEALAIDGRTIPRTRGRDRLVGVDRRPPCPRTTRGRPASFRPGCQCGEAGLPRRGTLVGQRATRPPRRDWHCRRRPP
jgi:DNA-binding Lrp family transcriptional regulator